MILYNFYSQGVYSLYKEVASAAAKWWKGQLASNSKSKYNHIIQEDHPMFILYYLCQEKYSGQVLNQFYVELKKRIEKELDILEELEASHFSDKRIMKLLRIDAKHLEVLRNKLQKRLPVMADD